MCETVGCMYSMWVGLKCYLNYIYISVALLAGVLNSPVQLWLSLLSAKPSWQVQKYDPRVLVHLWSHPLVLVVHSSISAGPQMHQFQVVRVHMYPRIIVIV